MIRKLGFLALAFLLYFSPQKGAAQIRNDSAILVATTDTSRTSIIDSTRHSSIVDSVAINKGNSHCTICKTAAGQPLKNPAKRKAVRPTPHLTCYDFSGNRIECQPHKGKIRSLSDDGH